MLITKKTILAAVFNPGNQPNADAAGNIVSLESIITNIFNLIWILFIAFSIIMFLVAAFQFLSAQGEADVIKKARMSLIWGVVGIIAGVAAFVLPFIIQYVIFF